jgi:hypothetical protein
MTIVERVQRLVNERDIAIYTLNEINKDISDGEHVDSNWIKDSIELNAGLSIIERSNFNIEIKKLKRELSELRKENK